MLNNLTIDSRFSLLFLYFITLEFCLPSLCLRSLLISSVQYTSFASLQFINYNLLLLPVSYVPIYS